MNTKTLNQLASTETVFISNTQATESSDALTLKLDDISDEVVNNALYAREFAHSHTFN